MRFKNIPMAITAAAILLTPVAASANPAAKLSLNSSAVQTDSAGAGAAGSSGGTSTGTVLAVVFGILAVAVGVTAGGDDSDSN